MGRARNGSHLPVIRAFSAGGVVLRQGRHGPELVLGLHQRDRRRATWGLPKGTPDGDETPEETALREVHEETGLQVRILDTIGDIHYRFVRDGHRIHKTVHYFLMEATGGDLADHDHEFDDVRWFALGEADAVMRFATERDIVARALPVAGLA